jgi:hypothetical protein
VFPGVTYEECVPSQLPGDESDPAEIRVDVVADEPEADEPEPPVNDTNETTNGTANETSNDTAAPEDENGLPVPWQLAPLGLGAAALARRET